MPENGILPVSDNSHSWEIAPRAPCQQWEMFKTVFFLKIKFRCRCELLPLNPPSYLASNLQICCAEALAWLESQEASGSEALGVLLGHVFSDSFFIAVAG